VKEVEMMRSNFFSCSKSLVLFDVNKGGSGGVGLLSKEFSDECKYYRAAIFEKKIL